MRRLILVLAVSLAPGLVSFAAAEEKPPRAAAPAAVAACAHGVQKTLCARCNPRLEAVFKSKGDWCAEHARPESQCVICNPELAKKGVK